MQFSTSHRRRGKGNYIAYWLLLGAMVAMAAFVICAASSSTEVTTSKSSSSLSSVDLQSTEVEYNDKVTTTTITEERSIIGDIEKLKRIREILQTVGEKVIPILVQGSNTQADDSSDMITKSLEEFS